MNQEGEKLTSRVGPPGGLMWPPVGGGEVSVARAELKASIAAGARGDRNSNHCASSPTESPHRQACTNSRAENARLFGDIAEITGGIGTCLDSDLFTAETMLCAPL